MEKILKGESIAHISSQKKLKPYSKTIVFIIIGCNQSNYKWRNSHRSVEAVAWCQDIIKWWERVWRSGEGNIITMEPEH
jgi:hypothetical protein